MRRVTGIRQGLMSSDPPPTPPGNCLLNEEFSATSESKNAVLDKLVTLLIQYGALLKDIEEFMLRMCLDEALVNAVMHGSQFDPNKKVRVRAFIDPIAWTVVIEDEGKGFKEEDLPDPNAEENLLEESGRGVILMRNFMDSVKFWNNGAAIVLTRKRKPKTAILPKAGELPATKSERPSTRMFAVSELLGAGAAKVPVKRRLRDLESLLSVTSKINAEPDLDRLMLMLAEACSRMLDVERSTIWVVHPETGELITKVAQGMPPIQLPKGSGIVGSVAETAAAILIPDAYADPRFNPEVDKKSGFRTREILCYPLMNVDGTRVVGVIQALNKKAMNPDDPQAKEKLGAYEIELAGLIAAQAGVLLEQAALREIAAEKKRLQAELDLAQAIQQRLLPVEPPHMAGLDIAGLNRSATETSGDYYDYIQLDNGHLGVVIADVTGHGLGAALVMTAARAYLRGASANQSDLKRIMNATNALIAKDLTGGNFLSLCLADFDPQNGSLLYISAGHDPPLVYRASEGFAELDSTGPLMGIVDDVEFGVGGPLPLKAGDVLVFMTDGLFECMNGLEDSFGKERLKLVIEKNAALDAQGILNAMLEAADKWSEGQPQRDDVTVVVVKVGAEFSKK